MLSREMQAVFCMIALATLFYVTHAKVVPTDTTTAAAATRSTKVIKNVTSKTDLLIKLKPRQVVDYKVISTRTIAEIRCYGCRQKSIYCTVPCKYPQKCFLRSFGADHDESLDSETNATRKHSKEAIVLLAKTKKLLCYSCVKTPVKTPQCTCESPKCLLKAASRNSSEVSERRCTDEKWVYDMTNDGCLTHNGQYWCVCSSDYCNGGDLASIRGKEDCTASSCPSNSVCLDTKEGFRCICPPGKKCTHAGYQYAKQYGNNQYLSQMNNNNGYGNQPIQIPNPPVVYGQQPATQPSYGNQNSYLTNGGSYTSEQPVQSCPCQNGGLCVQLPSGTVGCSCRYGFTGDRCEKKARPNGLCDDQKTACPYLYQSYCVKYGKEYQCRCHNGFYGIDCELSIYSYPEIRDFKLRPFLEDDFPLIDFPSLISTTTTKKATTMSTTITTKQSIKTETVSWIRTNQAIKKRYQLKYESEEKRRYEDDDLVIVNNGGDYEDDDSSLNLANVDAILINENNDTDYFIDSMVFSEDQTVSDAKFKVLDVSDSVEYENTIEFEDDYADEEADDDDEYDTDNEYDYYANDSEYADDEQEQNVDSANEEKEFQAADIYPDPCETNPCNSGKCIKMNGGFRCLCPPGSYGKHCHLSSFGVCPKRNPCKNNGVCMDSDPVFKCICHSDYYGTFCDKRVNQCLFKDPCKNGARCKFVNETIQCVCAPGYTGQYCENTICNVINPCLNHGVCIMDPKFINYTVKDQDLMGVRCSCKPGYEGNRCETARYILGCPPINPCLYDGKCVDKPFGFECICLRAYYGNRCQFKRRRKTTTRSIFKISSNNFLTQYTTNTTMHFSVLGTTAKRVDQPKETFILGSSSCEGRFWCENRGVCLETTNGFQCQCLPHFTGLYCESSSLR